MVHAVDLQEFLDDLRSKSVSSTSRTQAEFIPLSIRVTPDEIRHRTFVWDLAKAINDLDLVDGVDTRAQAAVHAEYLVINDAGQTEVVEHVGKIMPDRRIAILS